MCFGGSFDSPAPTPAAPVTDPLALAKVRREKDAKKRGRTSLIAPDPAVATTNGPGYNETGLSLGRGS